ncbi:hypothetical protein ABZ439_15280 [Streptomyces sp. NPDC005840]|uniref:hypothetical protein n=1 Tax=Streptomyces sp. NPDC005840 TaxID=3157072 RepID=UPI0033DEFA2A
MHDLARALADQLHPGAAPRDVTVRFGARRQAPVEYRSASRGGPVTVYAQALHATLYGLPMREESLPTALDELLQATHTTNAPDAVLRQVAEQLRNAAEIIQGYQYRAQWDRYPADVAEQLSDAHNRAQHIAQALDRVAPVFSHQPTAPRVPAAHSQSAAAPVASPPAPATRHR